MLAEDYAPGEMELFYLEFAMFMLGGLLTLVNAILIGLQKGWPLKLINFGLWVAYGWFFFFAIGPFIGLEMIRKPIPILVAYFFEWSFPILSTAHFVFLLKTRKKKPASVIEGNPHPA